MVVNPLPSAEDGSATVNPTAQPVVVTDSPEPPVSGGVSAALVDKLFDRLQAASQTQIIVTLLVFAVVVIPMAFFLYKSTPPGAVKDRLGDEIKTSMESALQGLGRMAKLTPTDIDDKLLEHIRDQLQKRLQVDIYNAVDAKYQASTAVG